MAKYKVISHEKYIEALEHLQLPERFTKLIERKLNFLAENPLHGSLNCHTVEVTLVNGKKQQVWAFYVNMQYRICFVYQPDYTILLIHASDHYDTAVLQSYTY